MNTPIKVNALFLLFLFGSFNFLSKASNTYTLTSSSGGVTVDYGDYVNEMENTYIINTGVNAPIVFEYSVDSELDCDYIQIYEMSSTGALTIIADISGQQDGTVTTTLSTGKAKVVIFTDGSCSYSDTNGAYIGFDLNFSPKYSALPAALSYNNNGNTLIPTGNVGIGVATPLAKLHLDGSIRGNLTGGALKVQTDYGSLEIGPQSALFSQFNTSLPSFYFNKPTYFGTGQISTYNSNNLSLMTNGTTRMTILNSNGYVGVGTTAPTQALSLKGNLAISPIGVTSDEKYNGNLMITKAAASGQHINLVRQGQWSWSIGTVYNQNSFAIGTTTLSDASFTAPAFIIDTQGKIGIGTTAPDYLLTVNGIIHAKEVKIDLSGALADYVFDNNYDLMPLHQVEQFVKENKHLPEIPSAKEVQNEGLSIGDMQNKLLKKVEELTLYVIEQDKKITEQNQKIKELEKKVK
jgi:hypothetical protein